MLVDRGFLPEAARAAVLALRRPVKVTGNLRLAARCRQLHPPPDLGRGLWFSREVAPIAAHLGTEPVMIVARRMRRCPGSPDAHRQRSERAQRPSGICDHLVSAGRGLGGDDIRAAVAYGRRRPEGARMHYISTRGAAPALDFEARC
jgi:cytochrome oxidase assembly protein ShyY1